MGEEVGGEVPAAGRGAQGRGARVALQLRYGLWGRGGTTWVPFRTTGEGGAATGGPKGC